MLLEPSFLVPIVVGLSFAFFRQIFPAHPAAPSEPPLTDEERRVYRRWEIGAILPTFLFATVLGYAWYLAMRGTAGLFRHVTPDTRFLLQPDPIVWVCPAMALGIITSTIPLGWLYRALLCDRYGRYELFCNERVGFDGRRVFVLLAMPLVAGSAVFFLAVVTSFAQFTATGVEIGRPLSLRSKFYDYARVRAIEHRETWQTVSGNTIRRPNYVIRFHDGESWSTCPWFRNPVPEVDEQIARLISLRSGRGIVERP